MQKLFKILSAVVLTVFILVAGLLLISSFRIPGIPLDARSVLTGSMEPTIPTGSIVFIWPAAQYHEGDVITFQREESRLEAPITHRIVRAGEAADGSGPLYVTQGDANEHEDTVPVRHPEISGKVVFHVPFVGRLLDAAKTPLGFAVLIVVPALLVIFDEGRKIARQLRAGRGSSAGSDL